MRMRQFEIRFFDKLEVLVVIRAYTAQDDLARPKEAERLCRTHTIEFWLDDRRIARVKKGNAPLVTQDRQWSDNCSLPSAAES
jgi:hypothetical protein